jgi:hypothetical protein
VLKRIFLDFAKRRKYMKLLHRMICLVVISLLTIAPLYAAQDIGSVAEVTGGVDILRGGKLPAEPAKVGAKIAQGDIVRTKSEGKVQLHFKDDSVLTIAPDSRVALNEYVYEPEQNKREASIKIFQGLVHTVVNKIMKKETPDFTVETQTAVIGVRGTDYYTLVAPAVSDIYNNSGVTEVRNIFAEVPGTVKLQNKEYTQVSRSLPPTLPLPLTQNDINWIKGQMTPRVVARATGGSSSQSQLLSKVGGGAIQTQNSQTTTANLPTTTNVVQNLQSAIYVPPQPVRVVSPTISLPVPFNISIAWGSTATDLDLYLSGGPNGTIYYGNQPTPSVSNPAVYYTGDSVISHGAEVIVVKNWTAGQTYYAYVKNYTAQSDSGSQFSSLTMQFSKGGTVSGTPVSNPSVWTVGGATQIGSTLTPPTPTSTNQGSQWQAATINPSTGTITPLNILTSYNAPLPSTTTTVNTPVTPSSPVSTPASVIPATSTATVAPTATTAAIAR